MKKKFYDIIPQNKRSIRDIPLDVVDAPEDEKEHFFDPYSSKKKIHRKAISDVKKIKTHVKTPLHSVESAEEVEPKEESFNEWNSKRKFKHLWIVAALLLIAAVYYAVTWFSSAEIRVKPVEHQLTLSKTRLALKDVKNKLIELDVVSNNTVESKGFLNVDKKAEGTVVLYNSYSTAGIKIAAGTKLIAPNTLVYKTVSAITIPGYKMQAGKKVPGSIDVKVQAEQVGDSYNAPFTDFLVLAYKGTDKYEKVYGRSRTKIEGGSKGQVPNVSKEDISRAILEINGKLASSSEALVDLKVKNLEPGYIYIPRLVHYTYNNPRQVASKDGKQVIIENSVHIVIILLDEKSFSKELVNEYPLPEKNQIGSRVTFDIDISKIKASLQSDIDTSSIKKNLVYMYFDGEATVRSDVNTVAIASAVSGLSRDQALRVVADLVESKEISIDTHPWWTDRLPLNRGKIRVILQ